MRGFVGVIDVGTNDLRGKRLDNIKPISNLWMAKGFKGEHSHRNHEVILTTRKDNLPKPEFSSLALSNPSV